MLRFVEERRSGEEEDRGRDWTLMTGRPEAGMIRKGDERD
jgi:hypothetical protein